MSEARLGGPVAAEEAAGGVVPNASGPAKKACVDARRTPGLTAGRRASHAEGMSLE